MAAVPRKATIRYHFAMLLILQLVPIASGFVLIPEVNEALAPTARSSFVPLMRQRREIKQLYAESSLTINNHTPSTAKEAAKVKNELLSQLRSGKVDDNSEELVPMIEQLREFYLGTGSDVRYIVDESTIDYTGDWENVHLPDFKGRLGKNERNHGLYSISRLTFGNIPSNVICAATRLTQQVVPCGYNSSGDMPASFLESVPEHLRETVTADPTRLHYSYIDTHIAIDQRAFSKSSSSNTTAGDTDDNVIVYRGILRMEGNTLPSPTIPNRWETWFTGGCCMTKKGEDKEDQDQVWKRVFGNTSDDEEANEKGDDNVWFRYVLANSFLAFNDVIYLDEDLRITVGNFGTIIITQRPRSS